MAWLSVGTSHEDLCQKLSQHGILSDLEIKNAFRSTDRGDFVLPEDRLQAYMDRPYKRDHVHISAPHMYATVLHALKLQRGQSFLNIGSGSGYLCCLVAFLVGECGLVQGVDISPLAVAHSRDCVSVWRQKMSELPHCRIFPPDCIQIVDGDIFNLDIVRQVRLGSRFDRVYVGAAVSLAQHTWFLPLLREGGILVAPVIETHQLLQIRRVYGDVFEQHVLGTVHFAPLVSPSVAPLHVARLVRPLYLHHASTNAPHSISFDRIAHHSIGAIRDDDEDDDDGVRNDDENRTDNEQTSNSEGNNRISDMNHGIRVVQTISPNHLMIYPASIPDTFGSNNETNASASKWILPRDIWSPSQSIHRRFPREFKECIYTLLLCASCREMEFSIQRVPVEVWWHVVSFMSRDWFSVSPVETTLLQTEVTAMKRLYQHAKRRLVEEERLRRAAERERDMLRILVSRNQIGRNSVSSSGDTSILALRHTTDNLRNGRGHSYFANDSESDHFRDDISTGNNSSNGNDMSEDNHDGLGSNSDDGSVDDASEGSQSDNHDNDEESVAISDNETAITINNEEQQLENNLMLGIVDNQTEDIENLGENHQTLGSNGVAGASTPNIDLNANMMTNGTSNGHSNTVQSIFPFSQRSNNGNEDLFVLPTVPRNHFGDHRNPKRPRTENHNSEDHNASYTVHRGLTGDEIESVVSEDNTDIASYFSTPSHNLAAHNAHSSIGIVPNQSCSTTRLRGNTLGELTDDETSVNHYPDQSNSSQK